MNYTTIGKAVKLAGLKYSTAKSFRERIGKLEVEYTEKGLPPPTWEEKLARKPGGGAKPKLTDEDMNLIFKECTLNRKQRKKLQHIVTIKLGFDTCCRTIETCLRKAGLGHYKPTKKLNLTDL